MTYTFFGILLATALFVGMFVFFEVGRRIGLHRIALDPEGSHSGLSAIDGAIFGLLALLVGFTFFGAGERFDHRRDLIVEETNKISTAALRMDLLPAESQPLIRETMRKYLDSRLAFYRNLEDAAAAEKELRLTHDLQRQIWKQSIDGSRAPGAHPDTGKVLLPALNEMIDITTTRTMAMQIHPPLTIYIMLFALALISATLCGYTMAKGKGRNWLYQAGFAAVMAVAFYMILDLEFPRLGLIRVNAFDQALMELRDSWK